MIVDLDEEECAFLIRICIRAKLFAEMKLISTKMFKDSDLPKIEKLINKLKFKESKNDS